MMPRYARLKSSKNSRAPDVFISAFLQERILGVVTGFCFITRMIHWFTAVCPCNQGPRFACGYGTRLGSFSIGMLILCQGALLDRHQHEFFFLLQRHCLRIPNQIRSAFRRLAALLAACMCVQG